jgi:hypothetical protein
VPPGPRLPHGGSAAANASMRSTASGVAGAGGTSIPSRTAMRAGSTCLCPSRTIILAMPVAARSPPRVTRCSNQTAVSSHATMRELRLAAGKHSPAPTALEASGNLNLAVDRYARAWSDAWRMQEQDLPILEHQKLALREAGAELDCVRPGTTQALQNALQYEPATQHAMTQLQGRERAAQLVAGVEHEGRVQADPNLKAERLVKVWNGLEAQHRELSGWDHGGLPHD